jgi:hypothetical protein
MSRDTPQLCVRQRAIPDLRRAWPAGDPVRSQPNSQEADFVGFVAVRAFFEIESQPIGVSRIFLRRIVDPGYLVVRCVSLSPCGTDSERSGLAVRSGASLERGFFACGQDTGADAGAIVAAITFLLANLKN